MSHPIWICFIWAFIGFILAVALININLLRRFIFWAKPSMEENGRASGKRFAAFNCMALISYISIAVTSFGKDYNDTLMVALCSLVLTLFGVAMYGKIKTTVPPPQSSDPPKEGA